MFSWICNLGSVVNEPANYYFPSLFNWPIFLQSLQVNQGTPNWMSGNFWSNCAPTSPINDDCRGSIPFQCQDAVVSSDDNISWRRRWCRGSCTSHEETCHWCCCWGYRTLLPSAAQCRRSLRHTENICTQTYAKRCTKTTKLLNATIYATTSMVGVASVSLQAAYRRTHSQDRLSWAEGWRLLGAIPYSSYEPGELSQWLSLRWQHHKHYHPYYNITTLLLLVFVNWPISLEHLQFRHVPKKKICVTAKAGFFKHWMTILSPKQQRQNAERKVRQVINNNTNSINVYGAVIMASHFESSPGSYDEYGTVPSGSRPSLLQPRPNDQCPHSRNFLGRS